MIIRTWAITFCDDLQQSFCDVKSGAFIFQEPRGGPIVSILVDAPTRFTLFRFILVVVEFYFVCRQILTGLFVNESAFHLESTCQNQALDCVHPCAIGQSSMLYKL